MARIKQEEYEKRIIIAEEVMVRLRTSQQVVDHLSATFGIQTRQAWRYITEVRRRWAAETNDLEKAEARRSRRSEMRATLRGILAQAQSLKRPMVDSKGNIMTDANGQPITYECPDLQRALGACKLLIDLDALALPKQVEVKQETTTTHTHKITDRGKAALEAVLVNGRN